VYLYLNQPETLLTSHFSLSPKTHSSLDSGFSVSCSLASPKPSPPPGSSLHLIRVAVASRIIGMPRSQEGQAVASK